MTEPKIRGVGDRKTKRVIANVDIKDGDIVADNLMARIVKKFLVKTQDNRYKRIINTHSDKKILLDHAPKQIYGRIVSSIEVGPTNPANVFLVPVKIVEAVKKGETDRIFFKLQAYDDIRKDDKIILDDRLSTTNARLVADLYDKDLTKDATYKQTNKYCDNVEPLLDPHDNTINQNNPYKERRDENQNKRKAFRSRTDLTDKEKEYRKGKVSTVQAAESSLRQTEDRPSPMSPPPSLPRPPSPVVASSSTQQQSAKPKKTQPKEKTTRRKQQPTQQEKIETLAKKTRLSELKTLLNVERGGARGNSDKLKEQEKKSDDKLYFAQLIVESREKKSMDAEDVSNLGRRIRKPVMSQPKKTKERKGGALNVQKKIISKDKKRKTPAKTSMRKPNYGKTSKKQRVVKGGNSPFRLAYKMEARQLRRMRKDKEEAINKRQQKGGALKKPMLSKKGVPKTGRRKVVKGGKIGLGRKIHAYNEYRLGKNTSILHPEQKIKHYYKAAKLMNKITPKMAKRLDQAKRAYDVAPEALGALGNIAEAVKATKNTYKDFKTGQKGSLEKGTHPFYIHRDQKGGALGVEKSNDQMNATFSERNQDSAQLAQQKKRHLIGIPNPFSLPQEQHTMGGTY